MGVRGGTPNCMGAEYVVDFQPNVKLEVIAPEHPVNQAIEARERGGWTGKIGDGKVFVIPDEQVIRIRPSGTGAEAL